MKNNRKSIAIYLAVVFVLSYAVEIFLVAPRLKAVSSGEVTDAMAIGLTQAMMAMCMFFPALSVLITRAVTNDWDKCYLRPNLKGNAVPYLIGWFGPLVLVCVGAGVWFLLHPESLTPFSNPYAAAVPGAGGVVLFVLLLILAPLLNVVTCFGEEWGWRGFLMPRLHEGRSFLKASVLTGIFWGLWHAPLIAAGHNYNQVVGVSSAWMVAAAVLAMCVLCVVVSVLFGYIAERARSVWPAVFAHGCLNGTTGLPLMFTAAASDPTQARSMFNPFVGPLSTGVIGGIGFIIVAIVILVVVSRKERRLAA